MLLDVIAVTALIIYLIRVALGYKQTRDRYQVRMLTLPSVNWREGKQGAFSKTVF